jgi:hypothetical protein
MGKCTFQKLNEKTAKRAIMGRPKATKKSKARTEALRLDKIKRKKEWKKWWI